MGKWASTVSGKDFAMGLINENYENTLEMMIASSQTP
jgi:hypothetical protein